MNKKLLLFLSFFAVANVMLAIPAKRGIYKQITTADGRQVRVQLVGDEHAHYYQTAEGKTYTLQGGFAVEVDVEQLQAKARVHRAKADNVRNARLARRKVGGAGMVYEGKKKGIIILAEFKDLKFEEGHTPALFQRIANEENFSEGDFRGSVSDYFKSQSGGRFELDFDVVGPIALEQEMAYYGENNSSGDDKRPEKMIEEACKAVDNVVNFKDYDWDGDGEVDQVFVLYAGLGEAAGGDLDTVWPHEWNLSATGTSLTLDDVVIDTYACSSELTAYDFDCLGNVTETGIDGIGTICHEFSHCLGFPDMYDTSYTHYGMGPWDLMDSGSYNGGGFCPAGYTSYEKMVAGWLTPVELTGTMDVSGMTALSEGGQAYIISNKAHPDEFYMLENRQLTGWDSELLGDGLLILHVDYDEEVWYNNTVNNDTRQRCTIIPADGQLKMYLYEGSYYVDDDDVPGDPYPYGKNNCLNNVSKPAAKLYNANTDGSKLMNVSIYDITRHDDGTISFSFTDESGTQGGNAQPLPEGVLFSETFDECDGTGGNDNLWSGKVADATFAPDNDGWEAEKAYGAKQCARFGTSSASGLVTTPSFDIDGEAVLTFKAGAWNASKDGVNLQLYVDDETVVIDQPLLTMEKGAWTDFEVTLTGTGTVRVTFSPDNRMFLDEVLVVKPTTGIRQYHSEKQPTVIRNLQGIAVGQSVDALPHGIYIINGKKVVK